MISSCRLIVSGLGDGISIYDIPPHLPTDTDSTLIGIYPIWTWYKPAPTPPRYLACSPVTFGSRNSGAVCWVVDSSAVFHRLSLSTGGFGDPVIKHEKFTNEAPCLGAIGNARGMYCTAGDGTVTIETVTVSDRIDRGSVEIALGDGMRYCEERRFTFEEFTGRIGLPVLDGEDGLHIIVADLV
jgi:hypothetical protein